MMIPELISLRDVSHDAFKSAIIPFLPELLIYRPDGRLIWRTRDEAWFCNSHACAVWNARYPGTLALDSIGNHGYRNGSICSVRFLAHRVVWAIHNGSWPDECDRENGIRSDNRIGNLFDKDKSGNQRNASLRSDNTSGHVGVYFRKDNSKWGANIFTNGRLQHLGFFNKRSDAIAARKVAQGLHGFHPNHGKARLSSKLRSIEVTLPWPAPQVFPNYRNGNHWRKSWKQVKQQRETAFILAAEQIGRQTVPRDQSGQWPVHLDIYPPNDIRRDADGMVGACKGIIDGISDALRVDDSRFDITHTIHPPRRPDGAVVVTVTEPEA